VANSVLLVSGSLNPMTLEQLAFAQLAGFHVITLSPEQKAGPARSPCTQLLIESIATCLNDKKRVAVVAALTPEDSASADAYAKTQIGRAHV
jgi:uncharacterized protein YgbK (DUF1537 family)